MKAARFLLLALLSGVTLVAQVPATDAAPQSAADRDFAAYNASKKLYPPREMDKAGFAKWSDEALQDLAVRGVKLYEAYPADPRRWEVVQFLGQLQIRFIKEIGPDFETAGAKAITADEAAKAAWKAKIGELWKAMQAAPDLPPGPREEMDWTAFAKDFRATTQAKTKGEPYDYAPFAVRFDAHVEKYPKLDAILMKRADDYLGALDKNAHEQAIAAWAHLETDSPNEALRRHAGDKRRLTETMGRPLQMKFTAVDGREVDLAQLRGKVVLIDFWATWCGPCKEELPNVVANYKKYHDAGFEVIGIALENGKLTPKDTPEVVAAKLEAAKKILAEFTAGHDMLWPQYCDAKFWKTDFAVEYKIAGIPAMFLLDQEGKVASTNARGLALEREIKRLLKL